MTKRASRALEALGLDEKSAILRSLLEAHPELNAEAERLASQHLEHVADREVVAEEVAWSMQHLSIQDLYDRSGRQPDGGHMEPGEAAWEMLAEELEPLLQDMRRRAALGMLHAARVIGLGILLGLYRCRNPEQADTVLAWGPDFPRDQAELVIEELRRLGMDLPGDATDLLPSWADMLRLQGQPKGEPSGPEPVMPNQQLARQVANRSARPRRGGGVVNARQASQRTARSRVLARVLTVGWDPSRPTIGFAKRSRVCVE